jgi:hypothetical protein
MLVLLPIQTAVTVLLGIFRLLTGADHFSSLDPLAMWPVKAQG